MRKTIVVGLAAALAAGAFAAPATAAKKKPKTAAPVVTKLFFHGSLPVGEVESEIIAPAYLPMTGEEPTGSEPKSYGITNYGGGPNTNCAGNSLFPVWVGHVSGKVVGDLKVTLHTAATPGSVDVRVWPDVNSSLCNSTATGSAEYPEPAASATVALPASHGAIEVTLPNTEFTAQTYMMIQVTPVTVPPFVGRVLYDTPDLASQIEFSCVPPAGKTSCLAD